MDYDGGKWVCGVQELLQVDGFKLLLLDVDMLLTHCFV